jgi:RimJ/RimL family protein N-acetyltransferase
MSAQHIIYRLEPAPIEGAPPVGLSFVALMNPLQGVRCFAALREQFRWRGAVKALFKLASGRRFLFALLRENRILSYVWSTEYSPRYPIEPHSCLLGPMVTRREMRGRGLATALLRRSAARLAARGYRVVYIDTAVTNIASQRAITRAGFVPFEAVNRDAPSAG